MCASVSLPDLRPADGITEIEFELSDPVLFPVDLSSEADCRVRLEETIRRAEGTTVEFFTARDCSPGAVRDRAAGNPTVDAVRGVAETDDSLVVGLRVSGRCIAETVEGVGAIPTSVVARDGSARVVSHVPPYVDTSDLIDAVFEAHADPTLVARRQQELSTPVFTPRGVRQLLREQPTDRQWEVLRTAYLKGYFERPREHTGEEVAESLDISSATFSQHLRSALRNLLSVAIETETTAGDRNRNGDRNQNRDRNGS